MRTFLEQVQEVHEARCLQVLPYIVYRCRLHKWSTSNVGKKLCIGKLGRRLPRKSVLLVDDEPGIRVTMPLVLRKHGFDVTVAGTVQEAFDKIQDQNFDLLLCDLNIDRVGDGFSVVRAMRTANPDCVAIIITGYPCLESAIEGIHHALDDYVVKPTITDALIATMRERLMARQSNSSVN